MKREIDLNAISDGRLYELNDMVKADCNDCAGCSACCRGMGNSIVLDPMDLYRLMKGCNKTFQELLRDNIDLNVVDGIIQPNLRMSGEEEKCTFLNEQGRCTIHPFRPGICRLFPLARIYDDKKAKYFLQIHECPKTNRSKVKVKKWIDIPESSRYEQFMIDWKDLLHQLEDEMDRKKDESFNKQLNMLLLQMFFVRPYGLDEEFYPQFYQRVAEVKGILS